MAAPVYYALYVLGNDNMVSLINTVNIIPSILGFMTTGYLLKKFGLTKTARLACVIRFWSRGQMLLPRKSDGYAGLRISCHVCDNSAYFLSPGHEIMRTSSKNENRGRTYHGHDECLEQLCR